MSPRKYQPRHKYVPMMRNVGFGFIKLPGETKRMHEAEKSARKILGMSESRAQNA